MARRLWSELVALTSRLRLPYEQAPRLSRLLRRKSGKANSALDKHSRSFSSLRLLLRRLPTLPLAFVASSVRLPWKCLLRVTTFCSRLPTMIHIQLHHRWFDSNIHVVFVNGVRLAAVIRGVEVRIALMSQSIVGANPNLGCA